MGKACSHPLMCSIRSIGVCHRLWIVSCGAVSLSLFVSVPHHSDLCNYDNPRGLKWSVMSGWKLTHCHLMCYMKSLCEGWLLSSVMLSVVSAQALTGVIIFINRGFAPMSGKCLECDSSSFLGVVFFWQQPETL